MSRTTVSGRETATECEAPSTVTVARAPARSAMNFCARTGMFLSAPASTNHEGTLAQAGSPDASASAASEMGRWVLAMTAAWRAGTSAANCCRKSEGLM